MPVTLGEEVQHAQHRVFFIKMTASRHLKGSEPARALHLSGMLLQRTSVFAQHSRGKWARAYIVSWPSQL